MIRSPPQQRGTACPAGYLRVVDAAGQIGLSPAALYQQIRQGRLPAHKFSGTGYCVRATDWAGFLRDRQQGRRPRVEFPSGYILLSQAKAEFGINANAIRYLIWKKEVVAVQRRGIWGVRRNSMARWLKQKRQTPRIPSGYLSPQQASAEFGLTVTQLRSYVRKGRVVAQRHRDWFIAIERQSLMAFLRLRQTPTWYLPRLPAGMLSVLGAAKRAGVAPRSIRNWIEKKGLPTKLGPRGRKIISEADLQTFLKHRAAGPRAVLLPSGYLSLTQAAKRAGVKRSRISTWIDTGALPTRPWKQGRQILAEADLSAFLNARARQPKHLNLAQASRQAGITEPALKRWIRKGELAAMKGAEGHYRIKEKDLQGFLQRRAQILLPTKYGTDFLTAHEVAKEFGVDSSTVVYWIKRGDLAAKKMPNRFWCIARSAVAKFRAQRAVRDASLTLRQASQQSGLNRASLQRFVANGDLVAVRPGRRDWRIPPENLTALLRKHAASKSPPHGYLTPRQASEIFHLRLRMIYELIYRGVIESVRYGKRRALLRKSLEGYLTRPKRTGTAITPVANTATRRNREAHQRTPPKGWLSLPQAARFAGVREPAVKNWIRKQGLPADTRSRGGPLIRKKDLVEFLAKQEESSALVAIPGGFVRATPHVRQAGLPLNEAARLAGVAPEIIRGWVQAGELRAFLGAKGQVRVFEADLQAFLQEQGVGPRSSVLVVDADTVFLRALTEPLAARGHAVRSAQTCAAAKMILAGWLPQVAIINVGTEQAWDLVEFIRTNLSGSNIQLVLIGTEDARAEDLQRAIDWNVQRLLMAPISADRVLLELDRLLDQKKPETAHERRKPS